MKHLKKLLLEYLNYYTLDIYLYSYYLLVLRSMVIYFNNHIKCYFIIT